MIIYEQLSEQVIGAAIEVHRALGPGLLESVYHRCMEHELGLRGIEVDREVPLPVIYKGIKLDCGYRMDLVADRKIVLELKAIDAINKVHEAQLLTYLKLSGLKVGLLINFNCDVIRNSIIRRVL